jgi:SAM-dependent methyltransferase
MTDPTVDMSTDDAWEQWGQRDPYFGVITDPKFRRTAINEDAKREFFESGAAHVHHVLTTIRQHIDPHFKPRRILDFGCGVGRLVVSFARIADEVIGLDISRAMLHEAERNCAERQLQNVQLLRSDDDLSTVSGSFDLIHSSIVFQHIPVERGRTIFANLLRHLRPGGVGAVQITYSKAQFSPTHGVAPATSTVSANGANSSVSVAGGSKARARGSKRKEARPALNSPDPTTSEVADPEIQMNPYDMNQILFLLQSRGVQHFRAEFSDHGGELGLFLFFSVPANADLDARQSSARGPDSKRDSDNRKMDLLIGGIPRSGTTALARGIELHPDIFCWSSESALLPMFNELTRGLPMRSENRRVVEQAVGRHLTRALIDQWEWHRKTIGVSPPVEITSKEIERLASRVTGALERGLSRSEVLDECACVLRSFLQQYTDRRVIAEKSPSNVFLIPDSLNVARRWLLMHREPFAVVASMLKHAESNPSAAVMRGEIERRIGLYVQHAGRIMAAKKHPGEAMVLDYDHLLADPTTSLTAACRFIEVEPTLPYLESVRSIIGGQTRTNTWKHFDPLDRWKVLNLCAAEMEGLGYSQQYYQVAFDDLTRGIPESLPPSIQPLYGIFEPAGDGGMGWVQRSASAAVYASGGIDKLVLKVHNKVSPLMPALRSCGLDSSDLQVTAYSTTSRSRVVLSKLQLGGDFSADWSIDLRGAEPVGHHGNWRLFKVDFESSFAYTPCCALPHALDVRTFSFGVLGWQLAS